MSVIESTIEGRYQDTPDLRYVLLTPEERTKAVLTFPPRWRDAANDNPDKR